MCPPRRVAWRGFFMGGPGPTHPVKQASAWCLNHRALDYRRFVLRVAAGARFQGVAVEHGDAAASLFDKDIRRPPCFGVLPHIAAAVLVQVGEPIVDPLTATGWYVHGQQDE